MNGLPALLRRTEVQMLLVAIAAAVVPIGVSRINGLAALVATALIFIGFHLVRPVPSLIVFAIYLVFIETMSIFGGERLGLLDEVTVPALALITLVRRWSLIPARLNLVREGAVVALFVLAIISSLVNAVPPETWLPGMLLMGKGIAFLYVTLLQDIEEPELRLAGSAVLAVAISALALGFVEIFVPQLFASLGIPAGEARSGLPSAKGIFAHPLVYAWFATFVALFLYAFHAVLRHWWLLALAIVFSLGTILAARRRAIIALAAGVTGGIVWEFARRSGIPIVVRRWGGAVAALVLLVVVFLPSLSGLYQMTVENYVDPGVTNGGVPVDESGVETREHTQARVALYDGSVEIARDHFPLGVGLGRYGSWMSRVNYSPVYVEYGLDQVRGLHPENPKYATDTFWPQVLGEVGVLGAIAYAVFLATIAIAVWRISRQPWLTPWTRAFCLGAGMILIQTVVESLASSMFHSPARVYLVMGTLGAVFALAATHAAAADRQRDA